MYEKKTHNFTLGVENLDLLVGAKLHRMQLIFQCSGSAKHSISNRKQLWI